MNGDTEIGEPPEVSAASPAPPPYPVGVGSEDLCGISNRTDGSDFGQDDAESSR